MYNQFLRDLWGDKDDGLILVWLFDPKSGKKESYWYDSAADASVGVEKAISKNVNVYMGAGLSPRSFGLNQRCPKKDISGIGALWLDLDILAPEHAKTNLPANHAEAMELLSGFPLEPSYIVNSGHGLQAWWCLKEVWSFNSPYERADAANLEHRLIYHFKALAAARGWDVDSVQNLDRVMRMPGSINYKSMPKPVTILKRNAALGDDGDVSRYNPSDFEALLPALPQAVAGNVEAGKGDIVITLDARAEPPFDKHRLLLEVDPRFAESWNKQRKDFASNDYSMSTYDLSLARLAYGAAWTDQEVCNLLIAFRRSHGADLKMQNLQYYQRTLARAKLEVEKRDALETITAHAQAQGPASTGGVEQNEKEILLQSLSAAFGVQLTQIKRYVADPPVYGLVTARGSITLGDVDNLIGQRALRSKIAAVTGKYIPKFKEDRWDNVAQALLDCCMDIQLDDAATEEGEAREWLEMYLEAKPPLPMESIGEALAQQMPIFMKDGTIGVFGMDFRKWLRVAQQEKVTAKKMGILLRGIGGKAARLNYERDGKPTTRSIWSIEIGG